MLYIESPAGVGYSIAGDPEDEIHTDLSQSEDALAALKDFYEKFPTLKTNDLFISGESYAGIYVPYLAYQIYQDNLIKSMRKQPTINIKGIIVGNGATDFTVDVSPSYPDVIFNFQLIPKSLYDTFKKNKCHFSFNGVLPESTEEVCTDAW